MTVGTVTLAVIVQIVDAPTEWLICCKTCGKPQMTAVHAVELKARNVVLGRCTCKEG